MGKHSLLSFFLACTAFLVSFAYFEWVGRSRGFSCTKIHSLHPYESRWDFGPPSKKQEELLEHMADQTFSLLGSGRECYAFVSDDGKYVIKFFKQKHMRTQYILDFLPLPKVIRSMRAETLNRHNMNRQALYQSCQLAYERLPQETGVLYLHLTKTKYLKKGIRLATPKGKTWVLKLDDMEFLIQKRAYPIFDGVNTTPERGQEIILSILDLISKRYAKGVGDCDINCEKNLGLIEGRALQIDIGEFYPSIPKSDVGKELAKATQDLFLFLQKSHPTLASYLETQLSKHAADATYRYETLR